VGTDIWMVFPGKNSSQRKCSGEAMVMKKVLILAIIIMLIALIGLISFIFKTRGVNAGAFILPGIIAVLLFTYYLKNNKS
jgi:hypothetical protein